MSHSWQEFNAEASTSSSKHLKGLPILSRLTRELKSCFLLSELDLDIDLNKQKFYLHFVTLTTSLAKSVFKVLTHQSLWNDEKSFFFWINLSKVTTSAVLWFVWLKVFIRWPSFLGTREAKWQKKNKSIYLFSQFLSFLWANVRSFPVWPFVTLRGGNSDRCRFKLPSNATATEDKEHCVGNMRLAERSLIYFTWHLGSVEASRRVSQQAVELEIQYRWERSAERVSVLTQVCCWRRVFNILSVHLLPVLIHARFEWVIL